MNDQKQTAAARFAICADRECVRLIERMAAITRSKSKSPEAAAMFGSLHRQYNRLRAEMSEIARKANTPELVS